ncbi:Pas47 [Actinoplanes phage phiAsp2]|uniref:Pas47 n=1 Tax=Actinoplanes phage phiAsp2 TaxID=279303 RepID=Q6J7Y4_9CAUD|nr:Pas47 [Actinoplanes phage phiAsp2]AAT36795.1 Pas47 [Actinoplanes phage phiAsp2]
MPDLGELADGTVLGLVVTYGPSRPYPVIGYKAGGNWHLTGERSPNKISSDDLAEWLMSGGRHLRLAQVLAEFEVGAVPVIDLGALLDGLLGGGR